MRKIISIFSVISVVFGTPTTLISEEASHVEETKPFHAFTGKITGNKVRLRQHASLDSPIIKELVNGDLILALGEEEDFFAVQPPASIKGYIFRTFVLDNVVEGNKVNVRLEPDLNSPVVAQLNGGDRVDGTVSTLNNKWLEIPLPSTARLYVAKEYVEEVGNASLLAILEKKKADVSSLLTSTCSASQTEMQKSYTEMNIDGIVTNFHKIIKSYSDFPEHVTKAKESLAQLQECYIQKKIAYLESKNLSNSSDLAQKNQQIEFIPFEQEQDQTLTSETSEPVEDQHRQTIKINEWIAVEAKIYEIWATDHDGLSEEQFYMEQQEQSLTLNGTIEPYIRSIKNKPGNYLLVNKSNQLPIAYLYSTKVDLQEKLGKEAVIKVVPRPNNNFAYPAYFVLSVE